MTKVSDTKRKAAPLIGAAICLALGLVACTSPEDAATGQDPTVTTPTTTVPPLLQQARTVNRSNHVSERFTPTPVVVDDPWGFETSKIFFDNSEVLIISDGDPQSQLRAASLAVVAHAPMVVYSSDHHAAVVREIERLDTHTVFAVGNVPVLNYSEKLTVIRDPGGLDALEKATALQFGEKVVDAPEKAVAAVAGLDPNDPVWLKSGYGGEQHVEDRAKEGVVPLQSRQNAEMAPHVIAVASSPLAAVATARGFGADVYVVDDPDPRVDDRALLVMTGLADKPLIALGPEFGTDEELRSRIKEAEATAESRSFAGIEKLPQVL
ncbi:hypothetical protein [Corynebacterium tuscaniense]|uniref:hypothetical protein n=1 Tax=Corynebacterium tuscaniense TaxID=302449 RepID=UPI002012F84E|nr:hypothetical protein [Corynebacterium tuscaniense]